MLQLAAIIKEARVKKGYSQQQLADLIGIKRTTYAEWEKSTEPQVTDFLKIALALDINPMDVFSSYKFKDGERPLIEKRLLALQLNLDALKEILLTDSQTLGSLTELGDDDHVEGHDTKGKARRSGKQDKKI